jgi:hypothetical protein
MIETPDDKKGAKGKPSDEKEFLDLATKRLKREIEADDHNRKAGIEDLKFINGDQWEEGEKRRRSIRGRPYLQVNELPKYVNQVVGDMRHNRARIKVIPGSPDANAIVANVRQGIISEIEYDSNAEAIYDYTGEMMTSCGYGAWRILTRYLDDDPFLQEIYLERIRNPFLVYMDSSATSEVYADAKYGFVLEKVTEDEFEERYPGQNRPDTSLKVGTGVSQEIWYADSESFFIADYYVIESEKRTVCLMKDGTTQDKPDIDEKIAEWEKEAAITVQAQQAQALMTVQAAVAAGQPAPAIQPPSPPQMPGSLTIVKSRDIDAPRVRHYAITADTILDGPNDVPGKYIPIILAKGPDRNIEGKTFVRSLIRDAKDPQRMLNFWVTDAAEIVDMIPKAPWIGTAKQFEGYEQDYASANVENFPFLKYNIDTGENGQTQAPPPKRNELGQMPAAVFQQISICQQAIRDAIGMYKADVGDQGPERTGKAIIERQKPSDVGTFCFVDNLRRAIAHSGKVINEMLAEVYDTDRDVPIRNIDDTQTFMPVNTTAAVAAERVKANPESYAGIDPKTLSQMAIKSSEQKFNSLKDGTYDVQIHTGPNYATQRQETSDKLMQLAGVNQNIAKIGGDILIRNMDFEGAEELADRLEATLPPGMVIPKPGKPKRQMPPNPQAVIAAEELKVQQADLEVKKMGLEVKKAELTVKKIKAIKEVTDTKKNMQAMLLGLLKDVFTPEQQAGQALPSNSNGGQ